MKRLSAITSIEDTGLITSTVITGGVSIAAFGGGVGLSVGIELILLQQLLHKNLLKYLP